MHTGGSVEARVLLGVERGEVAERAGIGGHRAAAVGGWHVAMVLEEQPKTAPPSATLLLIWYAGPTDTWGYF